MSKRCEDHVGNKFLSISDMCKYWGISQETYCKRIKRGLSTEEALTKSVSNSGKSGNRCEDHNGNVFMSDSELCSYWKVDLKVYRYRIKAGWSVEDALTKPVRHSISYNSGSYCEDHIGNTFRTVADMCKYWGVSKQTFYARIRRGYSIKDALSGGSK